MKVIDFYIDKKTGKIRMKTDGFVGAVCYDESNKVLQVLKDLGVEVKVEQDEKLPEFFFTKEEEKRKVRV